MSVWVIILLYWEADDAMPQGRGVEFNTWDLILAWSVEPEVCINTSLALRRGHHMGSVHKPALFLHLFFFFGLQQVGKQTVSAWSFFHLLDGQWAQCQTGEAAGWMQMNRGWHGWIGLTDTDTITWGNKQSREIKDVLSAVTNVLRKIQTFADVTVVMRQKQTKSVQSWIKLKK